jgi:hypothetical protein
MPISRMLELSTKHLTPDDLEILDGLAGYGGGHPPASHPITVHPHATGWIVRILPLDEAHVRATELGLSRFFLDVVQHAQSQDAATIRFAVDGQLEPGLPTFTLAHAAARKEIEGRLDDEPTVPQP